MGHTMAAWKTLEDILIALRKKDIQIPANVIEDLRAARSMIDLSYSEDAREEAVAKAEVYTANVEAYLISQAQEVFEPTIMDEWFKRLKEANSQADNEVVVTDGRFVVGAPRDQKWIRIETDNKLPEEYVFKLAEKWHLTVNKQTDRHLIVYGQPSDVKSFIKQIANQTL
ncbi:MAG: DUF2096 family protein [Nitrososphaerota archaeon]|jgi:hypothetical protein|nr:DUF2096 family protein [Nitrososphaerota archaeon]